MITKSKLAIDLSKLKGVDKPKIKLEQYVTDSEIAAEILWTAYLNGDIEDKVIADLGCGNGIFSFGCLKLNAGKVFAVEKDKEALKIAKENIDNEKCEFVNSDVKEFDEQVDTVIQNPPYGTRNKHADREFLIKSFEIGKMVYSMHKLSTVRFVEKIAKDNQFEVVNLLKFKLPLKKSYEFHKSKVKRIEVGCWIFRKQQAF